MALSFYDNYPKLGGIHCPTDAPPSLRVHQALLPMRECRQSGFDIGGIEVAGWNSVIDFDSW